MKIDKNAGYDKLNADQKRIVMKGIRKLDALISSMGDAFNKFVINNPVIHDSYDDFYVYKFVTKSYSVRILYRYYDNELEIHMFHFKKGDRDNSKYIETFEEYAYNYQRSGKYEFNSIEWR